MEGAPVDPPRTAVLVRKVGPAAVVLNTKRGAGHSRNGIVEQAAPMVRPIVRIQASGDIAFHPQHLGDGGGLTVRDLRDDTVAWRLVHLHGLYSAITRLRCPSVSR